jgi:hypothetical protein
LDRDLDGDLSTGVYFLTVLLGVFDLGVTGLAVVTTFGVNGLVVEVTTFGVTALGEFAFIGCLFGATIIFIG